MTTLGGGSSGGEAIASIELGGSQNGMGINNVLIGSGSSGVDGGEQRRLISTPNNGGLFSGFRASLSSAPQYASTAEVSICVRDAVEERNGLDEPLSSASSTTSSSTDVSVSALRYPPERLKTLISFVFMICCMVSTTLALSIVHDRVPSTAPLPDVVFDFIPQWDLGLSISEYLLIVTVWLAIFVVLFHRHRWIIYRRVFLIIGLLYFGRAVTMLVTALPVANTDYYCSPKVNHTSALVILERMWKLISGLGLSVNGQHVFCGDYIYSGHTCMLVLSALVVTEYSPRKLLPVMIAVWLMAAAGIVCVSFSRGHYTVDILLAYYITTRIWWIYHAIACHPGLKEFGPTNYLSGVCWFRLARYFERNCADGKLPKQYNWPLPLPKRWKRCRWDFTD